jgi:hypothetical protein
MQRINPKFKKVFVVVLAVIVAFLHFVIGPNYRGPFRDFIAGYLIDILLPFLLYFLITLNFNRRNRKLLAAAGIVIFACVVEYLQFRGVEVLGSVYDPFDLLAYAAGVISALTIDLVILERIQANK